MQSYVKRGDVWQLWQCCILTHCDDIQTRSKVNMWWGTVDLEYYFMFPERPNYAKPTLIYFPRPIWNLPPRWHMIISSHCHHHYFTISDRSMSLLSAYQSVYWSPTAKTISKPIMPRHRLINILPQEQRPGSLLNNRTNLTVAKQDEHDYTRPKTDNRSPTTVTQQSHLNF